MEAFIKKFFWTLPVFVIAFCAYFGAKAVNHIIESKAMADSSKIGKAPKVIVKPSAKKKSAKKSKKGDVIATRNMFCSACLPLEEEEDDASVIDSDRPPTTSLPLRLVATNVSTEAEYSFATIQNTSTDRQGSYNIDQMIPGGGAVVRISTKYVDFENTTKKRVERLSLLSTKIAARKPTKTPEKKTTDKPKNAKDEMLALVEEGVNKISDTEFELDRKVVDKILSNPTSVMRGARIVPSIKNGKANGFKLYAIRPKSVYAMIGLRNGDTIHSINGMELTSLDKGLEIYSKLKSASSLSVNATRRGKPVGLSYTIK